MSSRSRPVIIPSIASATQFPESFPSSAPGGNVAWKTLISRPLTQTDSFSAGHACCPANGGTLALHSHAESEVYYVLSGRGEVTVGNEVFRVQGGDLLFIPGGMVHGVVNRADKELKWLYFFPTCAFGNVVYEFHQGQANVKVKAKL